MRARVSLEPASAITTLDHITFNDTTMEEQDAESINTSVYSLTERVGDSTEGSDRQSVVALQDTRPEKEGQKRGKEERKNEKIGQRLVSKPRLLSRASLNRLKEQHE